MKTTCAGLLFFVLAACGAAQPSATSSTPTADLSRPLLFAVLEANGTANAWTYNTVAIVGLDGVARARTTFTPMPVPALGCMGAILPPSAHVAAGKVFFADAKGVVRSLSIDGTVATAATFPMMSTQQLLSFAVSPDGTRLLGTVFTIPTGASACEDSSTGSYSFDAYSATTGGAVQLVYHQSWTKAPSSVIALTGWDALGPFGTDPTVWATQGGGPGSTLGVFVRIDATTMKASSAFSDPSVCQVWDSVSSGAFVCMKDAVISGGGTADQKVLQPVSIRRADGTELWHFTVTGQNGPFGPYLAPDGQHAMICCNDLNLADSHELLVGRDGTQVNLAKGFGASGWLDSTTMVGALVDGNKMAYVAANAPGTIVSLGFAGTFVGTVRA
jgi:hypothetical protein